jgi:periplasmic protein TonB
MKNKLKIMDHQPHVSDDEINAYMDFPAVLERHNQALQVAKISARRWWAALGAVSVIATVCTIWLTRSSTQDQKPVNVQLPASVAAPQKSDAAVAPLYDSTHDLEKPILPSNSAKLPGATHVPLEMQAQQPAPAQEPASEVGYVQAEPVNGYPDLYKYLSANLVYPTEALRDSVQGVLTVSFMINREGRAENIEILNSLGPSFDEEVNRLIVGMPLWKPAVLNGKPIPSKMSLPITFQYTGIKRKD